MSWLSLRCMILSRFWIKDLAGDVMAEVLFLKRATRPIRENRIVHVQNGLIEKRDHRERSKLDILSRIPSPACLFGGSLDRFPHLVPKALGIADMLTVSAHSFADGENFLKTVRQVLGASF